LKKEAEMKIRNTNLFLNKQRSCLSITAIWMAGSHGHFNYWFFMLGTRATRLGDFSPIWQ
jgi:hypothetical protein